MNALTFSKVGQARTLLSAVGKATQKAPTRQMLVRDVMDMAGDALRKGDLDALKGVPGGDDILKGGLQHVGSIGLGTDAVRAVAGLGFLGGAGLMGKGLYNRLNEPWYMRAYRNIQRGAGT